MGTRAGTALMRTESFTRCHHGASWNLEPHLEIPCGIPLFSAEMTFMLFFVPGPQNQPANWCEKKSLAL